MPKLHSWIPCLEDTFHKSGLTNVTASTFPPLDIERKAFTDDALMGIESMMVAFSEKERKATGLDNRDQWQGPFEKAVAESKNGMSITSNLMVFVGQKPA